MGDIKGNICNYSQHLAASNELDNVARAINVATWMDGIAEYSVDIHTASGVALRSGISQTSKVGFFRESGAVIKMAGRAVLVEKRRLAS